MNKHEEAEILFKHLLYSAKKGLTYKGVVGNSVLQIGDKRDVKSLEDMIAFNDYITQSEATEKELEELKRKHNLLMIKHIDFILSHQALKNDVNRLFTIEPETIFDKDCYKEYQVLKEKLSKGVADIE
jgi:hypothetical protein